MNTQPTLEPQEYPEIIVGLVAPVGVDFENFSRAVEAALSKLGYETHLIHLTQDMIRYAREYGITDLYMESSVPSTLDKKIEKLMEAGNRFRSITENQAAFAHLAVASIYESRAPHLKQNGRPKEKVAYIIRQLKRPEEIRALRNIYGRHFIQVSAYSPHENRVEHLAQRISQSSQGQLRPSDCTPAAQALIKKDEEEASETYGQRLRGAFSLADVIVDLSDGIDRKGHITRFFEAFFGHNFITPTRDEYGMFTAKSAALRSSDLSRQVGAAIAKPSGEIICTGCNEVPKAYGGTYWSEDSVLENYKDGRDHELGKDSNYEQKEYMVADILNLLQKAKWLNEKYLSKTVQELTDMALHDDNGAPLEDAMLMDVLEFGRMLHAEMSAITDAARLGIPVKETTLYTTTFPCHMCARHIVGAGISRVVFVEPYPKSFAIDLHNDAITLGNNGVGSTSVTFEPFVGIAPNRYAEVFTRGRRKDKKGNAVVWADGAQKPIISGSVPSYLLNEKSAIGSLEEALTAWAAAH